MLMTFSCFLPHGCGSQWGYDLDEFMHGITRWFNQRVKECHATFDRRQLSEEEDTMGACSLRSRENVS